jgi:hypothetical protein
LLPRCTPFDGILWSDDFHRANGNLWGRNGWASNFGAVSPLISSNTCVPAAADQEDAINAGVFGSITIDDAWFYEFDILWNAALIPAGQIVTSFGDFNTGGVQVTLQCDGTLGGGHNVSVNISDTFGNMSNTDIAVNVATTQTYGVRRSGASIVLSVDGVDLAVLNAADFSGAWSPDIAFYFFLPGATTFPVITRVAVGLT